MYTLPNQPAKDNVSILVRVKDTDKQNLINVCEILNTLYPGANYTITSVCRQAILDKITELEKLANIRP